MDNKQINFKFDECPICGGEQKYTDIYEYGWKICSNDCSAYFIVQGNYVYYDVYDDHFHFDMDDLLHDQLTDDIIKLICRIDYWKENDRYLIRMLTNDN